VFHLSARTLLEQAVKVPNHATLVLQLVATAEALELKDIRQGAAAHFKNIVKYSWNPGSEEDEDGNNLFRGVNIAADERTAIKDNLVQLMCTAPKQIQGLLSESIALIAASDYPTHWQNLMPSLVRQWEAADTNVLLGALKTADSVCRGFRHVERTDALYAVIVHTLNHTQVPLTVLMTRLGDTVAQPTVQGNKEHLLQYMEALRLVCSTFYSLNYQDLPAYFEENMSVWMGEFEKYLQPGIFGMLEDPEEEDDPSALDLLQTAIVKILRLYSDKDEEDFVERYLQKFVTLVLNRLLTTTLHKKHDPLVTSSIRFIASLIVRPAYSQMFIAFLPNMVERIVLPNLYLREGEIEDFSDNPFEFILTEIEGADSESRRSAVQALMRSMTRNLEEETVKICQAHIQALLQRYKASPDTEWAAKDVAVSHGLYNSLSSELSRNLASIFSYHHFSVHMCYAILDPPFPQYCNPNGKHVRCV
jgi:exportin-2 (importin alpha re-exporter)